MANAKIILTQPLAPDISQSHVMKLLHENLWPIKQVFCHFAKQSLTQVPPIHAGSCSTIVSMITRLCFR